MPSTQEYKVWFDNVLKISIVKDIRYEYFKNADKVWFGFTSANGLKPTSQTVCINFITLEIDKTVKAKRAFEKEIFVYPDPENDKITVDFDLKKASNVNIHLYNSNGKIVKVINEPSIIDKDLTIDVNGLPSGIYYLNISDGVRQMNKKIIHIQKARA
jgi:hypothetical protein